jgi:cytolysin-activating lysine-acyltransferase
MNKTTPESNETKVLNQNQNEQKNPIAMSQIMGDILFLMMKAPFYKHLFLNDFEWLVFPAVELKQMRIFRNEKMPLCYISWASINEDIESRLLNGVYKLRPMDWNSGDKIFIIDNINLTGQNTQFLKSLNETVFKDKEVKLFRPKKDGKGLEGVLLKDFLAEQDLNDAKDKNNAKNLKY